MLRRNIFLTTFIIILASGCFLRLYNFPERVNFSSEQGLALLTSSNFINDGFSFLGQRTFLRTTSVGHIIFSGAIYNYTLVPLLLLFNFDPLPISYFFSFLNIFAGILMFFLFKKLFGGMVAIFSFLFFMTSSEMINHSMFIWILHYLPIISVLSIYLVVSFYKYQRHRYSFFLGVMSGLGFNFEYFYLFTLVGIFCYLMLLARNKVKVSIVYIIGCLIGNFTMVIFDLRHDFYTVRVLWQYLLDTISKPSQSQIDFYHFFQFWPVLFLLLGVGTSYLWRKSKVVSLCLISAYLVLNFNSKMISFSGPIGMNEGVNLGVLKGVSRKIADDVSYGTSFNVTNLVDNDFRAHTLRYLVINLYGKKPLSMEDYANGMRLYVFGDLNFNLAEKNHPWEVTIFKARSSKMLADFSGKYGLYVLER